MAVLAASVIGLFALALDYMRERRLEGHTQDRIDDHEMRIRALERPA